MPATCAVGGRSTGPEGSSGNHSSARPSRASRTGAACARSSPARRPAFAGRHPSDARSRRRHLRAGTPEGQRGTSVPAIGYRPGRRPAGQSTGRVPLVMAITLPLVPRSGWGPPGIGPVLAGGRVDVAARAGCVLRPSAGRSSRRAARSRPHRAAWSRAARAIPQAIGADAASGAERTSVPARPDRLGGRGGEGAGRDLAEPPIVGAGRSNGTPVSAGPADRRHASNRRGIARSVALTSTPPHRFAAVRAGSGPSHVGAAAVPPGGLPAGPGAL